MVKISKPMKGELKSLNPVLETAEEHAILIGFSSEKECVKLNWYIVGKESE